MRIVLLVAMFLLYMTASVLATETTYLLQAHFLLHDDHMKPNVQLSLDNRTPIQSQSRRVFLQQPWTSVPITIQIAWVQCGMRRQNFNRQVIKLRPVYK